MAAVDAGEHDPPRRRARRRPPLRPRHDGAPDVTDADSGDPHGRGPRQLGQHGRQRRCRRHRSSPSGRRRRRGRRTRPALLGPRGRRWRCCSWRRRSSSSSPSSTGRSCNLVALGHLREPAQRRRLRVRRPARSTATLLTGDELPRGPVAQRPVRALHGARRAWCSGVLLAVAAHRRLKGIKVFQTIFTLDHRHLGGGDVGHLLRPDQPGRSASFQVNWLNDPSTAMFGVSLSSIWQNLGLSFVIVLAGLQAVPDEVIEAATLDGYGPVRRLLPHHAAAASRRCCCSCSSCW